MQAMYVLPSLPTKNAKGAGPLRVVVAFSAHNLATILLVGPHDDQDPFMDVYSRLYELAGLTDPPTAERTKPPCCGKEDGKPPVFALAMQHHRHNVDVTFKVDGTMVLVETDVPAKELPKVVLRAVEHRYPGATLRGAESVKTGPEAKKEADYYQFYLLTARQRPALVKVDPNGKILWPEEKTAVKKRDKKALKVG